MRTVTLKHIWRRTRERTTLHHTLKVLPPDAIKVDVEASRRDMTGSTHGPRTRYTDKEGRWNWNTIPGEGGWYKRGMQEIPGIGMDATAIEIEQDEEGRMRIMSHKTHRWNGVAIHWSSLSFSPRRNNLAGAIMYSPSDKSVKSFDSIRVPTN